MGLLSVDMVLPRTVQQVLALCTNGAFRKSHLITALVHAAKLRCQYVPILAEESFRFPTNEWFQELRQATISLISQPEVLIMIIKSIFKAIAIVFMPAEYSCTARILDTKAHEVMYRLDHPE